MRIKPLAALVAASLACWNLPALASSTGLVISQVYGGGGATTGTPSYKLDWVELFNAGTTPIDLTGLSLQYGSSTGNFGASASNVAALPADIIQPGQYYLVAMNLNPSNALGADLPLTADSTGYAITMSATVGKIALVTGTTQLNCGGATACDATQSARFVDLLGYGTGTSANRAETTPTASLANTSGAVRKLGGCTDTDNNLNDFTVQTAPVPRNSSSPVNLCTGGNQPIVPSCPSSLAVTLGSAGTATLTARDADGIVNSVAFVSAPAAGITLGTLTPATANDGIASVALNVANTLVAGTYPAQVRFSNTDATPQTASCTVNISVQAAGGSYTPIYQIQGSGTQSPLVNQSVTTQGVVTKITNAGYYIQDAVGDGNVNTSDGIYVFTSTAPTGVAVGDKVQLTGTVKEYNTGAATNTGTASRPVTELTSPTSVSVLSTGNTITPTIITLPVASEAELERVEGMLVTINTPLTASQNYFLGRYGQITLSSGGRLIKPTNVLRPGTAAQAMAASNALRTVLLDDGISTQNPDPTPYLAADNTVRAGDTVNGSITGIIDYGLATSSTAGFGLYKIQPTSAVTFARANARTSAPAAVGGNIKVASANLLNFFTTFGDGTTAAGGAGQGCSLGGAVSAANCRGADSSAEFTRQRTKLIEELSAINADVFGFMEVQNNGTVALQNLIDGLNAKLGAGTYAIVPEAASGVGTDAIKTAIIYKPATVTRVGASLSDTDSSHKRLPQAQTFALVSNGEKFSVVVNHFKSKGSCPSTSAASDPDQDQGDGQGCWNATRLQEAQAVRSFVTSTLVPAAGTDRVLLLGDFNAYGMEDPINEFATNGYTNLAPRFATDAYSYVFDGEAGALDHAVASNSLNARVTSAIEWHVNADEPSIIDYNLEFKKPACATCGPDYYTATAYRSSDHDPIVIGLNLAPLLAQTISFPALSNQTVGAADVTPSASASSGLAVSYSASPATVCTVTGNAVHLVNGGTCTVTASQAGDAVYAAATSVSQSFTVLLGQTLTFNSIPAQTVGAGTVTLQATSSAGLPLSYSSSTPSVCTVSGSAVTLVSAGNCTITATQAGNGSYAAATPVSQTFVVNAASTESGFGDSDAPIGPVWLLLQGLGLMGGVSWFKRRRRAA